MKIEGSGRSFDYIRDVTMAYLISDALFNENIITDRENDATSYA